MTTPRVLSAAALLAFTLLSPALLRAQGLFPPTTAPLIGTQKSLQQIWDKIDVLETKVNQAEPAAPISAPMTISASGRMGHLEIVRGM